MNNTPLHRRLAVFWREAAGPWLSKRRLTDPGYCLALFLRYLLIPILCASGFVSLGLWLITNETMVVSLWRIAPLVSGIIILLQLGRWLRTGHGYAPISAAINSSGSVLTSFTLLSSLVLWQSEVVDTQALFSGALYLATMLAVIYAVVAAFIALTRAHMWPRSTIALYENGPFCSPSIYQLQEKGTPYPATATLDK